MSHYHTLYQAVNANVLMASEEFKTIRPCSEDWGTPLAIEDKVGWTNDDYLFNPGNHTPAKALDLEKLQKGKHKGSLTWRAAGSQSNHRAAAAALALSKSFDDGLVNVPKLWCGCILKKVGRIFMVKEDRSLWMSLGFQTYGVFGYRVHCVSSTLAPGKHYMRLTQYTTRRSLTEFFIITNVSEEDCPVAAVKYRLVLPAEIPRDLVDNGILLEVCGSWQMGTLSGPLFNHAPRPLAVRNAG